MKKTLVIMMLVAAALNYSISAGAENKSMGLSEKYDQYKAMS